MGWLISYTIASMAGAFVVVRLLEYVVGHTFGALAGAAKAGCFVSVWTAITTASGMRGFTKAVRQLRQSTKEVNRQGDLLSKDQKASTEQKRKEAP